MSQNSKNLIESTFNKLVRFKKLIIGIFSIFILIAAAILFMEKLDTPEDQEEKAEKKVKPQEQTSIAEKLASAPAVEAMTSATDVNGQEPINDPEKLIEIRTFASKNKAIGFMATIDEGMPRVRGISLVKIIDGRWFFATSKLKGISKQIRQHPYAEWITFDRTSNVSLRVLGKITTVEDLPIKQQAINDIPVLEAAFGNKIETEFELFYMDVIEAHWYGK